MDPSCPFILELVLWHITIATTPASVPSHQHSTNRFAQQSVLIQLVRTALQVQPIMRPLENIFPYHYTTSSFSSSLLSISFLFNIWVLPRREINCSDFYFLSFQPPPHLPLFLPARTGLRKKPSSSKSVSFLSQSSMNEPQQQLCYSYRNSSSNCSNPLLLPTHTLQFPTPDQVRQEERSTNLETCQVMKAALQNLIICHHLQKKGSPQQ